MTSPNTGPQPTVITDLPATVTANWRNAFNATQRAEHIKAQLPDLDEQIATVQARLEYLKGEHKRAGRDITAALTDAETSREMVELWCSKHGRPLPPEILAEDVPQSPAQTLQRVLPPGVHPVQDPGNLADVLGQGETTRTVVDSLGGGDAEGLGDFQPDADTGGNGDGGPGEPRV